MIYGIKNNIIYIYYIYKKHTNYKHFIIHKRVFFSFILKINVMQHTLFGHLSMCIYGPQNCPQKNQPVVIIISLK